MENIILVILCMLAALLLALALYVFLSPKKKGEGINIHVDGKSGLKITQNDEGMRLDIVYETSEEARPSYEMFPDIVDNVENDAVNNGAPSIGFWLDVACLNELDASRREEVVMKLQKMGIIKEEDSKRFLYPDEEEPLVPEFPDDDLYYAPEEQQAPAEESGSGDNPKEEEPEPGPEDVSDNPPAREEPKDGGFKFNEFKL